MLAHSRHVLPSLITALALTVGLIMGVIAPTVGLGFAPVLSPSMRPALAEGDLLVVRPVDTTRLSVGHIVLLAGGARMDTERSDVVAHRIVALERDEAGTHVHTQGDANPARDVGPRTITTPRASVVVASVPLLGHVALALASLPARLTIGAVVFIALVLATRRTMLVRHRFGGHPVEGGGPHAPSPAT